MKKAAVADATLRMYENSGCSLGFKEKIEIVKQLDRLCVDAIETAPLLNGKSDILFLHNYSPFSKNCIQIFIEHFQALLVKLFELRSCRSGSI